MRAKTSATPRALAWALALGISAARQAGVLTVPSPLTPGGLKYARASRNRARLVELGAVAAAPAGLDVPDELGDVGSRGDAEGGPGVSPREPCEALAERLARSRGARSPRRGSRRC